CMIQSLCRWFVLLVAVAHIEAQKKPPIDISSRCLGNIMRVDVGPLGGSVLEVSVVMNNSAFLLTPSLASQCGFSVKTDQLGNAMIFASLHNCFAQNVGDALTTTLNLRLHGNRMAEDELYRVAETCHYADWSSREIVCERNYIEVSVKRAAPDDYVLPANPLLGANTKFGDPRRAAEKQPVDTGFRITSLVFFTPEEKMMTVTEARRRGHGIANTPSRLVLRSPQTSPETYTQNVAGVPMTVLQTSTIFEKKWLATRINAAAACPTLEGSVSFTPNHITWYLPRHIDPLISSGQFKLLEVHMGIDGQRLDAGEMAARRYSLSATDMYVVVEIPIGAAGVYCCHAHVQDGQYLTSYTIEPMLELLWTEETTHEDTRYKVLFPITTPLLSRPAQVTDNTVPEEQIFKVLLGPFGSDVALMNVTFPHEVLSVADCSVRGFNVLEHMSPNSGSKVYTLEVPFTDPVVLQMKEMDITVYSLHMTFGLLVLPEFAPFAHAAYLEARVVEIVAPSVTGGCDHQNFNVLVKYGSQGFNFQATVGKQMLTPSLAQQYGVMENHTHLSFAVPFTAPDVAFEAVESSSIRSRLDVVLRNLETNKNIKEFSLACNFASFLTECFPNGTMTALAVKLESVPSLDPGRLTLRDSTCGPAYSDGRYAYFVFTGNSCGTTRKFFPNVMLYENEISLPDELEQKTDESKTEELKISCYYDLNTAHGVGFHTRPRRSEPYAENAKGELQVAMRLAFDDSYSAFHRVEDFPVVKYLQQPLYFEVELMKATNPRLSLELGNCWATLYDDGMSKPRWNLIIDGCPNPRDPNQVVFHPVWVDARVQYPSHVKRFEVQMFAFAEDQDNLHRQLFVHCDVMICDDRNPLGGVCNGQCSSQENRIKGQRRAVSDKQSFKHVSSGAILIS
uniref:ZP domain-containing protein n=1 Tax=Scophthalmus maximus TaxID=52904 RepID=A0A8D3B8A3_SCOMX